MLSYKGACASGLLTKKVANAVAVVILTFYPVVDDEYSPAHVIASSLLNRRASRNSIFDVSSEHINLFLSVSWIRTYLLKDKADMMINPCSLKFEFSACRRASFETEKEAILAIKSLSHDLLLEYQSNHLKCEVSDTSYSLASESVRIQHEPPRLSATIIIQVITPDTPEKTFKIKGGGK